MTEQELRNELVDTFASYIGASKGSIKHRNLVDIYNSYKPLPQGYKLKYTDAWCAGSASAIAILCKLTDIIPVECSCSRQIELWKKMGRWIEDESITPKKGMYCYYDWDDGTDYAKTDNKGAPEHVGIVSAVNGKTFTVIEGNKGQNSVVGYRQVEVNGRYLRGFGDPDFASKATAPTPTQKISTTSIKLPILKKSIAHPSVKLLQAMLNVVVGAALDIDGSFGPKTEAAVKEFQRKSGLSQDGVVGAKTWQSLFGN